MNPRKQPIETNAIALLKVLSKHKATSNGHEELVALDKAEKN